MKIGKFKVIDSFKVIGRGLVAKGEIMEGRVKVGSVTTIRIKSENYTLRIGGVEAIDNISTRESWVGLLFYEGENEQMKFENVKLEEQLIDIFEED